MKINVSTRELQEAIKKLEKVVNKKLKLPIFHNIILKADSEGITLTANNMESMLILNIEGQIYEQGLALIHYENFKLINKFKDNILEIESSNSDKVTFKGKRILDIVQNSPEDYAECILESITNQHEGFKINAHDLKDILKLKIATSDDINRPSNNGITMNNNYAYAVDGYRLIRKKMKVIVEQSRALFLSNDAIDILGKILGKENDLLEVSYILTDDSKHINKLIIKSKEFTLVSKCHQGEFFNAEQVIPKEFNNTLIVSSKSLLESLEFAKEIDKGMKYPVILTVKDDNMQVARNSEKRNSSEDIYVNSTFVDEFKMGFNTQYLIDAIKTLNANEIEIKFVNREINPIVINSVDNPDDELHMVLPVRLRD